MSVVAAFARAVPADCLVCIDGRRAAVAQRTATPTLSTVIVVEKNRHPIAVFNVPARVITRETLVRAARASLTVRSVVAAVRVGIKHRARRTRSTTTSVTFRERAFAIEVRPPDRGARRQ